MASTAATCNAVGMTSLDDCPMLTSSLAWTLRPSARDARVAITSLAFMLDEVPEPVWKTSIGNSASYLPAATAAAADSIASAVSAVEESQVPVHLGRRLLDQANGMDQTGRAAADRRSGSSPQRVASEPHKERLWGDASRPWCPVLFGLPRRRSW